MKKIKKFLTIPLIMVLFLSNTLLSYARTEWTFEEKVRYMEDNFSSFLSNTVGFVIGENDADVIYHSLVSIYEQKIMEANDVTYQDWLLNHLGFDFDDNNNVLGVEVDPVVINLMNDGVNQYVEEHPMSYSYQWIAGTDGLPATMGQSSALFAKLKEEIENCSSDFVIVPRANFLTGANDYQYVHNNSGTVYYYGGSNKGYLFMYPIEAYRTAPNLISNGHLNNYTYNARIKVVNDWTTLGLGGYSNTYKYWCYTYIASNGNVTRNIKPANESWTDGTFEINTLKNTNMNLNQPSANNQAALFISSNTKEVRFVYDSIDALKVHDTGQPAPYYYSSNYKGSDYVASDSAFLNTGTIENSGNNYEDITNNITNGMTAEEVIQLVDTIMKNNNDKPWSPPSDDSGGGGSDDGIWGSIGSAIGKLFGAIGDFLLGLINGLLEKVEDLIDSIQGIFDKLTDLVPNVLGDLFSSLFSWLPEEFVTLITASLGLIVIFGIIRMIRG